VAAGFASERNILRERALMLLDKEPWTRTELHAYADWVRYSPSVSF
jgi:hypothetical protein